MRRFVVVGSRATASDDFRIEDVPGTSGRLDVLARCIRAALLLSHDVRRDALIYLVLLGGPRAPRVVRIEGGVAKFLRPDERALAFLVKKALAAEVDREGRGFVVVRAGVAVARGGLDVVLSDLGGSMPVVLDERGDDVRECSALDAPDVTMFVGDHLGFDDATRAVLASLDAPRVSVGPVSLHSDDVVAIVSNELDRRHHASMG